MAAVPLLDELAVVTAVAVAVTVVLARVKLPAVAGLLAAGALVGPYGFGLARSLHAIEILAEVGVVLLLFSIGLEFSLTRLKHIFKQVALGGAIQVGLTTLVAVGIAMALGEPIQRGLFYGFVFALSSTAIVLRALTERRELDAPHGRFIVGTLIFQDLLVVPMVLIVPILAPGAGSGNPAHEIGMAMLKACGVVIGTIVVARFLVPKILGLVDASRSREVFLLAILSLCIGTAWMTSLVGLSLSLGAFLGGVVVADTEYSHRAMGDILPLRDAFVSIFFVSLGMLFDAQVVIDKPLTVATMLAGFILLKGFLATLAAMAMRFPARVAWLSGVGLAQFGEFGFVLTKLAETGGLMTPTETKPLMAAGIASMFLTPLLVRVAPHITAGERLLAPLERAIGVRSIDDADEGHLTLEGHVVVVGYGLAGRSTMRALTECGIRPVGLELNAETVKKAKTEGVPVYYGDATSPEALGHAHLTTARMLVILMNDPIAAQRVADTARRLAPDVPIVMRTRYLAEREPLVLTGVQDVIAEEVEGAVEVIARMLRRLEVPRNVIHECIHNVRLATQTSDRKVTVPRASLGSQQNLSELKIDSVIVRAGSHASGHSAIQMNLRAHTGALVVAVRRGEQLIESPDPGAPFQTEDIVYLVGTTEAVEKALPLFDAARISQIPPNYEPRFAD